MGLLPLPLKMFRPKRHTYRYRQSTDSYRQQPARAHPIRHAPTELLQQVEEQARQQLIGSHCWSIDDDTIGMNRVDIRLTGKDAPELDHLYAHNVERVRMNLYREQVVTPMNYRGTSHERAKAT